MLSSDFGGFCLLSNTNINIYFCVSILCLKFNIYNTLLNQMDFFLENDTTKKLHFPISHSILAQEAIKKLIWSAKC